MAEVTDWSEHDPAAWFAALGVPVAAPASALTTPQVADALAQALDRLVPSTAARPFVIGIAGSVASGKTFLADALVRRLEQQATGDGRVIGLSTDGFIHPNDVLAERGLVIRKGYPESYDRELLADRLGRLKADGAASWPTYSHARYDRGDEVAVAATDVVVLEGVNVLQPVESVEQLLDYRIYLDAAEDDVERWFVDRFMGNWREARYDEASFYHQWSTLGVDEARQVATMAWQFINLPNLRDHIEPTRHRADLILHETADHTIDRLTVRADGRGRG